MDSIPRVQPPPGMTSETPSDKNGTPTWSGIGQNIGAGLTDIGSGLVNAASDPFGNLIGKPLTTAAVFAHDALAGPLGYQRFPDNVRQGLLNDTVPQPGTGLVNTIADATGAPRPEDVPANTPTERIVRKGIGAAGAGAALGPAPLLMSAMGLGGAVVGDQVAQAVPEWAQPMAELGGNLATQVGIGAGAAGLNNAIRSRGPTAKAWSSVSDALGNEGLGKVEVANAAELRARQLEQQLGAPGLSDMDRVAIQRELGPLQSQRMNAVPGSEPTLSQVAPNPQIKALENQSKQLYNPEFAARQEAQNNAQLAAVRGVGGNGEPGSVGQFFTSELDRLTGEGSEYLDALERQGQDRLGTAQAEGEQRLGALDTGLKQGADTGRAALEAQGQAQTGRAAKRVISASEDIGGRTSPDTTGEALRGAVAGPEAIATARINRMYDAIDPENKLVVDKTPAIQAAQKVRAEFGPGQWNNLPPELAPVKYWTDKIAGSNDPAQRFNDFSRDLQFLGTDIRTLRAKGIDPKSTTGHYLGILKTAMQNSIEEAVDRAAASDGSIAERLGALGEQNGSVTGGRSGQSAGESPAGSTSGVAGAGGVSSNPQGGLGGGQGGGAVAVTQPGARGQSLRDLIIANRGVQDQGGELKANDLDLVHHQRGGRLVNPNGMTLDRARELAAENGFIRPNADINEFLDALTSQKPVYRISDAADQINERQAARQAAQETHDRFMAGANIKEAASRMGGRLSPEEEAHATDLHIQGADTFQAVHDAARAGEEGVFQRNAEHNAVGAPGVPLAARQAEMPVNRPQLTPNLTAEDAAKISGARLAHAQKKETFWTGPVGEVLKGGPTYGSYSLENANVARKFLTEQPNEPGRVQKFIDAVGGHQQAVDAMQEALVSDLRAKKIIGEDGMVVPDRLKDWLRPDKRGRTVDMFPGLRERLGNVEAAQRTYDDTVAAHKQSVVDFNKQAAADYLEKMGAAKAENAGALRDIKAENTRELRGAKTEHAGQVSAFNQAAGKFVGTDPVDAMGRILNAPTRDADVLDVMARARNNPEVLDGLKRLTADYIERKFATGRLTNSELDPSAQMFNQKAYREFLDKNGDILKRIYGGQGYQSLYGVGADMRRQLASTEAQASPGPDTARKQAAMAKAGSPAHGGFGTTAFALIGENLAESLSHAIGGHGLIGVAAKVAGVMGGVLAHRLRQAGITSRNELIKEMLLNPKFALEMRAKVAGNRLSLIASNRIASALQSAAVANQGEKRQ